MSNELPSSMTDLSAVLLELIAAAREGCREDSPDWRYRPAWRRRLAAAVQQLDGSTPKPMIRSCSAVAAPCPPTASDDFAGFRAHYPRKSEGGWIAAEKSYAKARKVASAEEIMAGLLQYPFRSDPAYQPTAVNWLDRGCWMVEPDTSPATIVKERSGRRHEAAELAEEIGLDLMTSIAKQFPKGMKNGRLHPVGTNYAVAD